MTPSEREEIEKIIETDANRDINTTVKMIEKIILTQVEKARREAYNDVIRMIECHHVDEECPDHELADCTYRIIEEIRNKLEKE